jgi:hypothetical protein
LPGSFEVFEQGLKIFSFAFDGVVEFAAGAADG